MYGTKRSNAVNFGDKTSLQGSEHQPLTNIAVPEARAFTVYVTARVEPEGARVYPLVEVEWGNGGASIIAREYRVFRRLRVPVVASTVRVRGRLVDEDGKAPTDDVNASFSAFVAPGSDGETIRNTTWIAQQGATGVISEGAEQLLTVEGYRASSSPCWLMLFDATERPADGAFPSMSIPARGSFRRDRFDAQGFRFGVVWAASSDPMVLHFDASARLRVDAEVLT